MSRAPGKSARSRWINLASFAGLLLLWLAVTTPFGDKPLVQPLFLPSPQ